MQGLDENIEHYRERYYEMHRLDKAGKIWGSEISTKWPESVCWCVHT